MSETIAVWFSCGAASATAAKLTVEAYGKTNTVRVLNSPILEEGEDNRRFLRDVEKWIGQEIELVINPKWPNCSTREVWEKRKAMSFPHGAPCTLALKKEARQIWEKQNRVDWHVLGFTADEKARHARFVMTERDNVLPILITAGMSKQDCLNFVAAAGIELPDSYRDGFPNANCRKSGCVKATSPTYWNHLRKMEPEGFAATAAQSRRLGAKLVRYKGQRIFLDELPAGATGRPLREFQMPDCGVFCEEKTYD